MLGGQIRRCSAKLGSDSTHSRRHRHSSWRTNRHCPHADSRCGNACARIIVPYAFDVTITSTPKVITRWETKQWNKWGICENLKRNHVLITEQRLVPYEPLRPLLHLQKVPSLLYKLLCTNTNRLFMNYKWVWIHLPLHPNSQFFFRFLFTGKAPVK